MKICRIFLFVCLICSFSKAVFTQETRVSQAKEQTELETKAFELLSEVIDETASLKLAENRSFVSSIAAGLLWEKNEKLARTLFRSAADELIQLQNAPLNRRQKSNQNAEYYRTITANNLRGRLAFIIRQRDVGLALELLYATRSAELDNSVQTYWQIVAQTGKKPDFSNYKQEERAKLENAANEIQLEQEIKKAIAVKDPQKLAEYIRESFVKETTGYVPLGDLDVLNKKDHELAQKVLSEIMSKLESADFSNPSKWSVAYWIYRRYLTVKNKQSNQSSTDKNKELELDEKSVRKIANHEFDYLLTKEATDNDGNFVERMLYLKQILPERFSEIKAKYERAKGVNREWADDAETTETLGDNPTLNQIIESSPKLAAYSKTGYYRKAIDKILETESEEKTAQQLGKIPDEKDRENALDYLNSVSADRKAIKEDSVEAKKAILQIKSEKERIAKLIALAISYQQKKTAESQKIADDLMSEASKSVNENPETYTEYTDLLPVISGYASVNPKRAFELITPIINNSNELINAYVLLTNYYDTDYPYVSENEILLGGQDGYYNIKARYNEIAKKLAANDFEKSVNLIKLFQRTDIEILARLILIEIVLQK